MDTKVVCQSLETHQRYRFLSKKDIETLQASRSDVLPRVPFTRRYLFLGDLTASVLWVRQRIGSLSALSNASQPVVIPGTNAKQPSASSTSLPSGSWYCMEMNASVIFWARPASNS